MHSPLRNILVVALLLVGCSPAGKGPLSFQLPAGWKVEHQMPGGVHFYTVKAGAADEALMLSQWPVPSRPEEIPDLVKKLAEGFVDQAKRSSGFNLASYDYRIEHFTGSQCHGSFAVFQTGSGVMQTMFMMSVDGRVWNGQFTGSSNTWAQAVEVLKSVRKKG